MNRTFFGSLLVSLVLVACDAPESSESSSGGGGTPLELGSNLPVLHEADAERAARGEQLFTSGRLGGRLGPKLGFRNLWLVWGSGGSDDEATYWAKFRKRYGFSEAPFDNDGLPLGMRLVEGSFITLDCMTCHAETVAGSTVLGAGSNSFDLQGLYDDLVELNELAPTFGFPSYPLPFEMSERTGAAGANDAFGLGMTLAAKSAGKTTLNERYGFQQSPAWWTLKHKQRLYADGAGQAPGTRTMMATLLAFGLSYTELVAKEEEFTDLWHYLLTLEAPPFPGSVDEALAREGRALFDNQCASCHGVHSGPEAAFPDLVVDLEEIGTDPLRAQAFTAQESEFLNGTWFAADYPTEATLGYLAPPLVGVWATAPYLHNGSVPSLRALLDPASRPQRWQRVEAAYDEDTVGLAVEPAAAPSASTEPILARKVFDTSLPGLSAAGHDYGASLSSEQRGALLEYLKTL